MNLQVGQLLEFLDLVKVEDKIIAAGTHARIGNVLTKTAEPTVTLVLLGAERGGKILVNRNVVSSHCRIV